ncbi:AbrB/MazE/SpoVT family DNA-binding domain-containing protein [Halobellus sp. Atlit-38R]|jgi:antitoxin component of MazEF toxin-antitoxin module|uniref:AbrB/MazE/SpoVT family DNA-binding domain-containing protein n=1 Tax=Halobellus sp. Atlit-38R TaxID=2282131 RepID=UPI000EF269E7|nr:AbrB/MazE/SpoVT family DNA-binding domain-containing protein [Halobellus sp. Atlit-38R]RLM89557.1 AbrB/MazE/SpoVT family DNA-binding domain-containing protein [Halobellus sp. Atlit-38R]
MSAGLPTRDAKVQKSNGSVRITIPAEVVSEVDFEAGETVLMRPTEDGGLVVRGAGSVWESDY